MSAETKILLLCITNIVQLSFLLLLIFAIRLHTRNAKRKAKIFPVIISEGIEHNDVYYAIQNIREEKYEGAMGMVREAEAGILYNSIKSAYEAARTLKYTEIMVDITYVFYLQNNR